MFVRFSQKGTQKTGQPDGDIRNFLWKTEKMFGVLHENSKTTLQTYKIK